VPLSQPLPESEQPTEAEASAFCQVLVTEEGLAVTETDGAPVSTFIGDIGADAVLPTSVALSVE